MIFSRSNSSILTLKNLATVIILKLQSQYGEMARDIAGVLDVNGLRDKANIIAEYKSEVEETPTTSSEIISAYAKYEESLKQPEQEK